MNMEKELENIKLENYLLDFDAGEIEFYNDIGIQDLDNYIEKEINNIEVMQCI